MSNLKRITLVDAPQPRSPYAGKAAIILNRNAKRVTERVRRKVVESARDADVFFTESLEQAQFVTRRVVQSGYGTVITGGGDGTVANAIQTVLDEVDAQGVARPRFGVLKLGTGNAVADFLGAGSYVSDLKRIHDADTRPMDLLHIDGQIRSTFAGFGWDAFILNNYERMKNAAERFFLTRALFKSAAGYLIAGVGKSVPELVVKQPRWNVRVYNTGGMALQLAADGTVVKRFAPGAKVFEGPVRMACFGTTPYYGFKFNIMPFADRTPGMFHLRLVDMHPVVAVRNLRKAWIGQLDHPKVCDLQLSAARIEFDGEAPFQVAGDAAGMRHAVDVKVDTPVECLHFPTR